jgi:hypothetical protein
MSGKSAKAARRAAEEAAAMVATIRRDRPHPLLLYLRGVGFVGVAIGGAGIVLASYFWWFVALIYTSLLAGMLDIWLEKFAVRRKITLTIIVAALTLLFTLGYVWLHSPLEIGAMSSLGEYAKGYLVSGIPWEPYYAELRIDFHNPTDRDYEDLDLVIRPTGLDTARVAQVTSIPGVWFQEDTNKVWIRRKDKETRRTKERIMQLFSSSVPTRIRCPRLPRKSSLQIVMAVVVTEPAMPDKPGTPEQVFKAMAEAKRRVESVKIEAEYKSLQHPYSFGRVFQVQAL